MDMFNFANDIDVYWEWASVLVLGSSKPVETKRPYHCFYIGRKNRFDYQHSHEEIVKAYQKQVTMSAQIAPIFQKVMGIDFYIFRTKTLEEGKAILNFIQQRINYASPP